MADYDEIVGDTVKKIMTEIAEQREEILAAFVAKYGYQPDEIEQVIDMSNYASGVIRWSVRRREKKNESTR